MKFQRNQRQIFSIRKFKAYGAASVLLALAAISNAQTVQAEGISHSAPLEPSLEDSTAAQAPTTATSLETDNFVIVQDEGMEKPVTALQEAKIDLEERLASSDKASSANEVSTDAVKRLDREVETSTIKMRFAQPVERSIITVEQVPATTQQDAFTTMIEESSDRQATVETYFIEQAGLTAARAKALAISLSVDYTSASDLDIQSAIALALKNEESQPQISLRSARVARSVEEPVDNGLKVEFVNAEGQIISEDDVLNGGDGQNINVKVRLTFPEGATNKTATIKLGSFLRFSDDTSTREVVEGAGQANETVVNSTSSNRPQYSGQDSC
ncbi:YSIRK-type signal peptide-containing protein [Streptococcus pluranimalium]